MIEAWFVSDIHIESMKDKKARALLAFLNSLGQTRKATHLFLVGDIFDLWIGPHEFFVNKFEPIVERLKELNQAGVQIHYFEGNHDLHLRKFWQGQIGIQVHAGPQRFQLGSLTVHVEHGD